jgi:NTE family protein
MQIKYLEPVRRSMNKRIPTLGIALGGGGARGFAHIGVLKVLQQAGIFPQLVAGTSMGGIVGAMYANGMSTGSTTDIMRAVDLNLNLAQTGLVRGARIYDFIAEILGPETTFAQLRRPLAMVATDIVTGREVVLDSGRVVDAVRATISVPSVFTPVELGSMRLVDGGMLNNLPVDVVHHMGADLVIAVDVLPNFQANTPGQPPVVAPLQPRRTPRTYRELWHIVTIMISASTEAHLQRWPADVLLRPDLPADMDMLLSFDRSSEAIAAGAAAAEAALDQIQRVVNCG